MPVSLFDRLVVRAQEIQDDADLLRHAVEMIRGQRVDVKSAEEEVVRLRARVKELSLQLEESQVSLNRLRLAIDEASGMSPQ